MLATTGEDSPGYGTEVYAAFAAYSVNRGKFYVTNIYGEEIPPPDTDFGGEPS